MPHLDDEARTYERELPNMLKGRNEGQFVVIRGEQICHFEPSYEQALAWGYEHIGLQPFLVRRVAAVEPQVFYARHDGLCEG